MEMFGNKYERRLEQHCAPMNHFRAGGALVSQPPPSTPCSPRGSLRDARCQAAQGEGEAGWLAAG